MFAIFNECLPNLKQIYWFFLSYTTKFTRLNGSKHFYKSYWNRTAFMQIIVIKLMVIVQLLSSLYLGIQHGGSKYILKYGNSALCYSCITLYIYLKIFSLDYFYMKILNLYNKKRHRYKLVSHKGECVCLA